MGYWITTAGIYHPGDPMPGDISVPHRPTVWHNWNGTAWVEDLPRAQADLKRQIDVAAGAARARYASPGTFIASEYTQAEKEATDFQAVNYSGTVPGMVQDWLDNNTTGLTTAQQAADDILSQASFMRGKLQAARSARLQGKKNVDLAGTVADAIAARDAAVAACDAL